MDARDQKVVRDACILLGITGIVETTDEGLDAHAKLATYTTSRFKLALSLLRTGEFKRVTIVDCDAEFSDPFSNIGEHLEAGQPALIDFPINQRGFDSGRAGPVLMQVNIR
jgi:hypothetical protein